MVVPPQLQEKLGATYIFHRELGGGGMARVFLAEDTRLHRKVVVTLFVVPVFLRTTAAARLSRNVCGTTRERWQCII